MSFGSGRGNNQQWLPRQRIRGHPYSQPGTQRGVPRIRGINRPLPERQFSRPYIQTSVAGGPHMHYQLYGSDSSVDQDQSNQPSDQVNSNEYETEYWAEEEQYDIEVDSNALIVSDTDPYVYNQESTEFYDEGYNEEDTYAHQSEDFDTLGAADNENFEQIEYVDSAGDQYIDNYPETTGEVTSHYTDDLVEYQTYDESFPDQAINNPNPRFVHPFNAPRIPIHKGPSHSHHGVFNKIPKKKERPLTLISTERSSTKSRPLLPNPVRKSPTLLPAPPQKHKIQSNKIPLLPNPDGIEDVEIHGRPLARKRSLLPDPVIVNKPLIDTVPVCEEGLTEHVVQRKPLLPDPPTKKVLLPTPSEELEELSEDTALQMDSEDSNIQVGILRAVPKSEEYSNKGNTESHKYHSSKSRGTERQMLSNEPVGVNAISGEDNTEVNVNISHEMLKHEVFEYSHKHQTTVCSTEEDSVQKNVWQKDDARSSKMPRTTCFKPVETFDYGHGKISNVTSENDSENYCSPLPSLSHGSIPGGNLLIKNIPQSSESSDIVSCSKGTKGLQVESLIQEAQQSRNNEKTAKSELTKTLLEMQKTIAKIGKVIQYKTKTSPEVLQVVDVSCPEVDVTDSTKCVKEKPDISKIKKVKEIEMKAYDDKSVKEEQSIEEKEENKTETEVGTAAEIVESGNSTDAIQNTTADTTLNDKDDNQKDTANNEEKNAEQVEIEMDDCEVVDMDLDTIVSENKEDSACQENEIEVSPHDTKHKRENEDFGRTDNNETKKEYKTYKEWREAKRAMEQGLSETPSDKYAKFNHKWTNKQRSRNDRFDLSRSRRNSYEDRHSQGKHGQDRHSQGQHRRRFDKHSYERESERENWRRHPKEHSRHINEKTTGELHSTKEFRSENRAEKPPSNKYDSFESRQTDPVGTYSKQSRDQIPESGDTTDSSGKKKIDHDDKHFAAFLEKIKQTAEKVLPQWGKSSQLQGTKLCETLDINSQAKFRTRIPKKVSRKNESNTSTRYKQIYSSSDNSDEEREFNEELEESSSNGEKNDKELTEKMISKSRADYESAGNESKSDNKMKYQSIKSRHLKIELEDIKHHKNISEQLKKAIEKDKGLSTADRSQKVAQVVDKANEEIVSGGDQNKVSSEDDDIKSETSMKTVMSESYKEHENMFSSDSDDSFPNDLFSKCKAVLDKDQNESKLKKCVKGYSGLPSSESSEKEDKGENQGKDVQSVKKLQIKDKQELKDIKFIDGKIFWKNHKLKFPKIMLKRLSSSAIESLTKLSSGAKSVSKIVHSKSSQFKRIKLISDSTTFSSSSDVESIVCMAQIFRKPKPLESDDTSDDSDKASKEKPVNKHAGLQLESSEIQTSDTVMTTASSESDSISQEETKRLSRKTDRSESSERNIFSELNMPSTSENKKKEKNEVKHQICVKVKPIQSISLGQTLKTLKKNIIIPKLSPSTLSSSVNEFKEDREKGVTTDESSTNEYLPTTSRSTNLQKASIIEVISESTDDENNFSSLADRQILRKHLITETDESSTNEYLPTTSRSTNLQKNSTNEVISASTDDENNFSALANRRLKRVDSNATTRSESSVSTTDDTGFVELAIKADSVNDSVKPSIEVFSQDCIDEITEISDLEDALFKHFEMENDDKIDETEMLDLQRKLEEGTKKRKDDNTTDSDDENLGCSSASRVRKLSQPGKPGNGQPPQNEKDRSDNKNSGKSSDGKNAKLSKSRKRKTQAGKQSGSNRFSKIVIFSESEESGDDGDVEDNVSVVDLDLIKTENTEKAKIKNIQSELKPQKQDELFAIEHTKKEYQQTADKMVEILDPEESETNKTKTSDGQLDKNVKEEPSWLQFGYTQEPDTIFLSDDDEIIMSFSQPTITLVSSEEEKGNDDKKTADNVSSNVQVKKEKEELVISQIKDEFAEDFSDDWSDKGSDFDPSEFIETFKKGNIKMFAMEDESDSILGSDEDIFNTPTGNVKMEKESQVKPVKVHSEEGTLDYDVEPLFANWSDSGNDFSSADEELMINAIARVEKQQHDLLSSVKMEVKDENINNENTTLPRLNEPQEPTINIDDVKIELEDIATNKKNCIPASKANHTENNKKTSKHDTKQGLVPDIHTENLLDAVDIVPESIDTESESEKENVISGLDKFSKHVDSEAAIYNLETQVTNADLDQEPDLKVFEIQTQVDFQNEVTSRSARSVLAEPTQSLKTTDNDESYNVETQIDLQAATRPTVYEVQTQIDSFENSQFEEDADELRDFELSDLENSETEPEDPQLGVYIQPTQTFGNSQMHSKKASRLGITYEWFESDENPTVYEATTQKVSESGRKIVRFSDKIRSRLTLSRLESDISINKSSDESLASPKLDEKEVQEYDNLTQCNEDSDDIDLENMYEIATQVDISFETEEPVTERHSEKERKENETKGLCKAYIDDTLANNTEEIQDITKEKGSLNGSENNEDNNHEHEIYFTATKIVDNVSPAEYDERYYNETQVDVDNVKDTMVDKASDQEDLNLIQNWSPAKDDKSYFNETQVDGSVHNDKMKDEADDQDDYYLMHTQLDVIELDDMPDDDDPYMAATQIDMPQDVPSLDFKTDEAKDVSEKRSVSGHDKALDNELFRKKKRPVVPQKQAMFTEPQKLKTVAERRSSGVIVGNTGTSKKPNQNHNVAKPSFTHTQNIQSKYVPKIKSVSAIDNEIEVFDATENDTWLSKKSSSSKNTASKCAKRKRSDDGSDLVKAKVQAARSQLRERQMQAAAQPSKHDNKKKSHFTGELPFVYLYISDKC